MRAIDSIAARSVSQGGMRLSQCVGMELAMRSMSWRLRVSEFFMDGPSWTRSTMSSGRSLFLQAWAACIDGQSPRPR